MTESKHTPGPWVTSGNMWAWITANGSFSITARVGDDDMVVCSRQPFETRAEEMAANARLIAAAPALLAACKAVVDAGLIPQLSSLPVTTKTAAGEAARLVYAAISAAEPKP